MRVAVVGAGIGGLVAAIGLQRHGADVHVLEARSSAPSSGSGLSVFGNGWTALDSVGVSDAVRTHAGAAVATLEAGQRRSDGRWLARTSPGALTALRILHREDLHQALVGSLAPGSVRYGVRVRSLDPPRPGTGGAVLRSAGGGDGDGYDLVVAADGIRSTLRRTWPDDPGTRYSGYSTWRGITDRPVDLLGAAGETWGRGRRFGYAPLADGRVYWFAVATMPATKVIADEHAWVTELFRDWHRPISALVAATPPSAVFRLPIEELAAPLATFVRGRCVLLGDAAHAMTPDLGQGANQAMEDGATLAALLAPLAAEPDPDTARLDEALRRYDRLRRPRTQAIARQARMLGRVAQAGGPVTSRLRDLLVSSLPASLADRRLTELQSWEPPPTADAP